MTVDFGVFNTKSVANVLDPPEVKIKDAVSHAALTKGIKGAAKVSLESLPDGIRFTGLFSVFLSHIIYFSTVLRNAERVLGASLS